MARSAWTMKIILKKLFGILGLLIGGTLLIWIDYNLVVGIVLPWVGYNLHAPGPKLQASFITFAQLLMPLTMIWVSWQWVTNKPIK